MAVPIIEVKNLYKIYKVGDTRVHALDGVDFTINKGEFCAIVGPSGSGKSTLLNMLAGLEKPTKGEIIIDKIHIEHMTENQLVEFRRKRVGFIFQLLQPVKDAECSGKCGIAPVIPWHGEEGAECHCGEILKAGWTGKTDVPHGQCHVPVDSSSEWALRGLWR